MEGELVFDRGIEREVIGKTLKARASDKLLLVIDHDKWKSRAPYQRIGKVVLPDPAELEGKDSPRDHLVGSVPRQRPDDLRPKNKIIHAEIECFIRVCR